MNAASALSQIKSINSKFDSIFNQLESLFPQLEYHNQQTSFKELKDTISSIGISASSKSSSNITDLSTKYTPIFDKLNEKIKDLKELDKMIAEVKEDSEQMELIALNAMVISVKSGEKGQAFSKITENLQRLSKDMFVYSDKLSGEEAHLLEQINSLKSIFSGIIDSQRSISSKDSECNSDITQMLSSVTPSVSELSSKVDSIFPAIDRTKSVLTNKNQISGGLSSVTKILDDLNSTNSASHEELTAAFKRALDLISQISTSLTQLCSNFAGNWQEVIEIMENADTMRMDFESRFLNNHAFGNNNLARLVSNILEKYKAMINEFGNYQMVQKDLAGTCQNITSRAKIIYTVFENLRPVMSRLHHVRILQQIEVSKNDAIKSVQDSVTDMDNLINSANASLDGIQEILESFIQETGTMLSNFVLSITKDNENMVMLRNEKELIYGDLTNSQGIISSAFNSFAVFPDDFQKKCVLVQQNLQELMRLNTELSSFANELSNEIVR